MSSSRRKRVNAGQTATRTLETLVHRLKPIRRTLGRREVQRVTPDTCAKVGHDLGSSAFIALRRVLSFAVRRGYLATNPCEALERGERPSAKSGEVTVLTGDELHRLLNYADDATRPLIATAALSGLRQSELLALRWHDLDFESGVIRVRYQLSRGSANAPATLVPLKTDSSAREVVLVPALATILREHRAKAMKSGHHGADAYVFSTRNGTALSQRNATRSLALLAQRGSQASATHAPARLREHAHRGVAARPRGRLATTRPRAALDHARPVLTLVRSGSARGRPSRATRVVWARGGGRRRL